MAQHFRSFFASFFLLFIVVSMPFGVRPRRYGAQVKFYYAVYYSDAFAAYQSMRNCLELPMNIREYATAVEAEGDCFVLYTESGCGGRARTVPANTRIDLVPENFKPLSIHSCSGLQASVTGSGNDPY